MGEGIDDSEISRENVSLVKIQSTVTFKPDSSEIKYPGEGGMNHLYGE